MHDLAFLVEQEDSSSLRSSRIMKELRMGGKARSRAPSSRLSESTQDISHRREIILDALINSDASSIAKFNKIVQEQEEGVAYRYLCSAIIDRVTTWKGIKV
jgi:hypothetical protein